MRPKVIITDLKIMGEYQKKMVVDKFFCGIKWIRHFNTWMGKVETIF